MYSIDIKRQDNKNKLYVKTLIYYSIIIKNTF